MLEISSTASEQRNNNFRVSNKIYWQQQQVRFHEIRWQSSYISEVLLVALNEICFVCFCQPGAWLLITQKS